MSGARCVSCGSCVMCKSSCITGSVPCSCSSCSSSGSRSGSDSRSDSYLLCSSGSESSVSDSYLLCSRSDSRSDSYSGPCSGSCFDSESRSVQESKSSSSRDRVLSMRKIQSEALSLFKRKNADYGDAFATYGPIGVIMRMQDKISRLMSISNRKIVLVKDESIIDTLMDLHNYSAMALMLLREEEGDDDDDDVGVRSQDKNEAGAVPEQD